MKRLLFTEQSKQSEVELATPAPCEFAGVYAVRLVDDQIDSPTTTTATSGGKKAPHSA